LLETLLVFFSRYSYIVRIPGRYYQDIYVKIAARIFGYALRTTYISVVY
jgi:hypothetical protein